VIVRAVAPPVVLAAAGAAALAIDLQVARFFWEGGCPRVVCAVAELAEFFGHGTGVGLVVLAGCLLAPRRRWGLPRVLTAALGAGFTANAIKLAVPRWRPRHWKFDSDCVWDTFAQVPSLWETSGPVQSFPSAHAAAAAALAVALGWLFPRGRWLFVGLAACVCVNRVQASAHFPSDVLAGAAVGTLFAGWCLHAGGVAAAFRRLEQRLGAP
jgi:membrane-associated phospholipid phosphatase